MGNSLLKNLDIEEKTVEIGTKEFDTLWTQYSTDGIITRERAIKFIKKLATAVGLDYDTQQSESLLCRLEGNLVSSPPSPHGGVNGFFNDVQFRRLFFAVVDDSNLTLTVSLKKRKPIFGHPSEEGLCSKHMRSLMTHVIRKMIKFLEENKALETEGIFRISGHGEKMEELSQLLSKNPIDLEIDPTYYSVHDVGGTLKLFFRQMPTPLIPYDLYDDILEIARTDNPKSRSMLIKNIISKLPQFNALLLENLVKFLNLIHQNEKMTQMPATNLATCFTPTLVRDKSEDPMAILMDNQPLRNFVVELISHPYYYFDHGHIFFVRSDSGKTRVSPKEKCRVPSSTELSNIDISPTRPKLGAEDNGNSVDLKRSKNTRSRGVSSSSVLTTSSSPNSPTTKIQNHVKARSTDDIPFSEKLGSKISTLQTEKLPGLKISTKMLSPRKGKLSETTSNLSTRGSKVKRESKRRLKEGTEDLKKSNLKDEGTEDLKKSNLKEEGTEDLKNSNLKDFKEDNLKEGTEDIKKSGLKEERTVDLKENNLEEGTDDPNIETCQDNTSLGLL